MDAYRLNNEKTDLEIALLEAGSDVKKVAELLAAGPVGNITHALMNASYWAHSNSCYLVVLKLMLDSRHNGTISYALNNAHNEEVKRVLVASGRKGVISRLLSYHVGDEDTRMLTLLLASGCEGGIDDALSNAIKYNQLDRVKLLLVSGREYDYSLALSNAVLRNNLPILKLLLSIGREYNIEDVFEGFEDTDIQKIQPEILEELRNPSYAQYAVRTGKDIEGSETHHWQIGGLAFLAARAVVAHQSNGTESLPLKFRPG